MRRVYRISRANRAAYDGEGAALYGGRWNSRGTRVLYMSENRALAVLEVLVHLSSTIPDRYVLGAADIPDNIEIFAIAEDGLSAEWKTEVSYGQAETRRIGDHWVSSGRSAVLSVPSVIVGERNFVLNPAHTDFSRIGFSDPVPFQFDERLLFARSRPGG
ncbi:MAG TPA: RES family NAD+ phosphorylase [Candidatus Acidoferrales bacterium]|nr:RES family NAD+ phosphorylase [Candidatus Acidoferrales bacterium]